MKLVDMTITQFSYLLASAAPAPGGGSVAAMEGALGAALTNMVASLTIGKEKYAEHDDLIKELAADAEKCRHDFLDVIDRDTEAFNSVSAVFNMPRDTDEQKASRKLAMQAGLKDSTLTPYDMMCHALAALEITNRALGKTNINAASDLGVAALSLKAAVQGAWLNILINISGIKDEAFVKKYRGDGEAILAKALPLADKIYDAVLQSL